MKEAVTPLYLKCSFKKDTGKKSYFHDKESSIHRVFMLHMKFTAVLFVIEKLEVDIITIQTSVNTAKVHGKCIFKIMFRKIILINMKKHSTREYETKLYLQ